jgi:hypothetical protein
MDSRERLSEVSSPSQWSEVSPPPRPISRELPVYQSEIVSLELVTSPAEALIAHIALRSLGEAQSQPIVPRAWKQLFDRLWPLEPTRRQELALLVAEVVQRVFDLPAPSEEALPTIIAENAFLPPALHMLNDLQFPILGMLDIQSRSRFAQTSKGNRLVVQTWRKIEIERIFSNEKLRGLFPFFFTHVPQIRCPESFDQWPSEWASRILPTIVQQITSTEIVRESEKEDFLLLINPKAPNDLKTVRTLLQASYDISLVRAYLEVTSPWISLQSYTFLPEKAAKAREFFQQLDDSYVGFRVVPDAVTSCPCMTCIPEELFLQTRPSLLNFSKNGILALPESFQFSSKLSRLVLSHNRLMAIPDFIGRMTQLTSLDVSHNQLQTLPESFGSLINLEELDLSGNPITSLPDSFLSLAKLKNLRLVHVNLKSSFCHKLPQGVHVSIDSKYRFHPFEMLKMFPRHVHTHFTET